MNSIPTLQNKPEQLERLAAQHWLYSRAKFCLSSSIVLSVPCVLVLAVTASLFPFVKPYAAAWGVLVTLFNLLILERMQKARAKEAAAVQELFDCDLFELEWNALKVGPKPTPESVMEAAHEYKKAHARPDELNNWYPSNAGNVPLALGRVICQRANCRWEQRLRTQYAGWIGAILVAVVALVCIAGLLGDFKLSELFVTMIAQLLPAVVLGARQILDNREASDSSERLARHAEELLSKGADGALDDSQLRHASRLLQDEIFDRRRSAPPLFEWVYRRLRPQRDAEMNRAAEDLVKRILSQQPAVPPAA